MNYDAKIQEIITAIKADKGIVQPWRNYGLKHLYEAQASFHMGKTTIDPSRLPDELRAAENASQDGCICPPGGKHKDCPVPGHGGWK